MSKQTKMQRYTIICCQTNGGITMRTGTISASGATMDATGIMYMVETSYIVGATSITVGMTHTMGATHTDGTMHTVGMTHTVGQCIP